MNLCDTLNPRVICSNCLNRWCADCAYKVSDTHCPIKKRASRRIKHHINIFNPLINYVEGKGLFYV